MTNVDLKSYIDEKLEEISSEKVADAKEVMEYLTSVLRGETESEIVVIEGTGEGCSDARRMTKKPAEQERLKAAELLGKRYGLFKYEWFRLLPLYHKEIYPYKELFARVLRVRQSRRYRYKCLFRFCAVAPQARRQNRSALSTLRRKR